MTEESPNRIILLLGQVVRTVAFAISLTYILASVPGTHLPLVATIAIALLFASLVPSIAVSLWILSLCGVHVHF